MSASGLGGGSYGYAGEWTDASGLQYLRARYYSPTQGRFTSKDPFPGLLTQPASLTPYVYALNSPVLYSDPSGEFVDTLFDAISVGYDIYTIGNKLKHGCALVWQDWAALGVDAFSLAVPFFPSVGGAALRVVSRVDGIWNLPRVFNKTSDSVYAVQKISRGRKIPLSIPKVDSGGKNVLVGINSHRPSENFPSLGDTWTHLWKKGIKTTTASDWQREGLSSVYAGGTSFRQAFGEAMNNAERIHFDLTGLNVDEAWRTGREGGVTDAFTSFEFYSVMTTPSWLSKTTLWVEGQIFWAAP